MNILIYGGGVALTLVCVALWAMWLEKRKQRNHPHTAHHKP